MSAPSTSPPPLLRVPLPRPPRLPDATVDLDGLVSQLQGRADLLESAPWAGWSYVVPHAGPRLVAGPAGVHFGGRGLTGDPFTALDDVTSALGVHPQAPLDSDAPPFTGGFVGAFGYDLARHVEALPQIAVADRAQDDLDLRLTDLVVAVSPDRQHAEVVGRDLQRRGDLAERATRLARMLAGPADGGLQRRTPPATNHPPVAQTVHSSLDRAAYLAAVERALDHIAAGDAFQVNLTQRLTARFVGDVGALYRLLREQSPASHGAALPGPGIASISPETFLSVRGEVATTRPIKGTRPRADSPDLDAALADDLATARKDRAENVMIVDLERNDLGRVCQTGTVTVPRLCEVEALPTVWHLVSTVTGRLRPEVGYGGLLRALFPCGSITGAPKVSAMQIIESIEPVRRGWYCGAIGFLAPGAAELSVAIRTATLHRDGRVDFGAGGGIVADSDPAEEYTESLDKAAAFLRAVGGRLRLPAKQR